MWICGFVHHGLDTTSTRNHKIHLSRFINTTLQEMGMFDVWKDLHPFERDYTHYSGAHLVCSRIDYFLFNIIDKRRVEKCEIGVVSVSDHSPISVTIFLNKRKQNTLWRLNVSILNNKTVVEQIRAEIKKYLEENNNGEVDPAILWDAFKAVLRRKRIALTSIQKKNKIARYNQQVGKLKELEGQHKTPKSSYKLKK